MSSFNKREYFYAAANVFLSDEWGRRAVFTWGNLNDIPGVVGNWSMGKEIWLIEPVNTSSASSLFLLKNAKPDIPSRGYLYADSSDNQSVYVSNGFPNENTAKLSLGAAARWQLLVNSSDNNNCWWTTDFCLPENKNVELCHPRSFVLRNDDYIIDVYLNAEGDPIMNDATRLRRNTRLLTESSQWEILPVLPPVNKIQYWNHSYTTVNLYNLVTQISV